MTARIAIVADRDGDKDAHREIAGVLPLLGPEVHPVWVAPERLATADLSSCDGLWFVVPDDEQATTAGERAAYAVGHQAAYAGVPVLTQREGALRPGSLTSGYPDQELLGFLHAAKWRSASREFAARRAAVDAQLAAADAVPRTYVHQMRGPRHRWWRPFVSLGLLVALWLVVSTAISAPFFLVGSVDTIEEATSTWAGNLWLNLSLAALIPATMVALWAAHRRGWGRLFSVQGRVRWGWLFQAHALLVPLWLLYLGGTWVLSGQEVLARPEQWIGMLVVCLLTTPLQAAGEEIAFRGGLVQAVGSWFRSPVVAFAVTLLVSTVAFVAAHGSMDVWIWIDIGSLAVAACYLAWRTGGLEAGIAIHVVNNVLITLQGIILGGLDQSYVDTETSGSPLGALTSVFVMALATALLLWAARRRGIAPKGFFKPALG